MIEPLDGLSFRPVTPAARPGQAGAAAAPRQVGGAEIESDFGAMIGKAVTELAQSLRQAEAVSIAGIKGTASTQEVVETVMAAEQSLQSAIAVRDKIVSAYLEISRMAI